MKLPHEWTSHPEDDASFCRHCGTIQRIRGEKSEHDCPGPISLPGRKGMVFAETILENLRPEFVYYVERFSRKHLTTPSLLSSGLLARRKREDMDSGRRHGERIFGEMLSFISTVPRAIEASASLSAAPDDIDARPSRQLRLASSALRFSVGAEPLFSQILKGYVYRCPMNTRENALSRYGDLLRIYGDLRREVEISRRVMLIASRQTQDL